MTEFTETRSTSDETGPTGATAAATVGPGSSSGPLDLARGDVVGRYVILSRLGSGGMGVVFSAYDPELDRRVALKLLHREVGEGGGTGHARLLREARAMARLAHPNVITVHDVGTYDERVFVAMEFVPGRTLRQWVVDESRTWESIVDVFTDAARGLSAAHAADIVHRDFKPDNVMVGDDGRVRVLDFGLALPVALAVEDESLGLAGVSGMSETGSTAELDSKLTRTGAVMGTPAYMAPEQHLGESTDERTDQFSWCVALFESLYGIRPFRGKSIAELSLRVVEGTVREVPKDTEVPAGIERALRRGLRPKPGDRWPSIADLVGEIARVRTPSGGGRWRALGAAALAGGALTVGVLTRPDPAATPEPPPACAGVGDEALALWDDAAASDLRAVFAAAGLSYGDSLFAAVESQLGRWFERWRSQRLDACEATNVRADQSAELMDRRMACLDGLRREASATLAVLSAGGAAVGRAAELVGALPEPATCSRESVLEVKVEAPAPELAEAIEAIETEVARLKAMYVAGQSREVVEESLAVVERAEATGYAPLIGRAVYRRAVLLGDLAELDAAREAFERAYFVAANGRDEHTAIRAALGRGGVAMDQAELAVGKAWQQHARVALDRAGDPPGLMSMWHVHVSERDVAENKMASARAHLEAALAERRSVHSGDHQDIAQALYDLGRLAQDEGDPRGGERLMEEAYQMELRLFGPRHPNLANSLIGRATTAMRMGDYQDARTLTERGLEIYEGAFGPEHPSVAGSLHNLGSIEISTMDYPEARAHLERALGLRRKVYGERHPLVAATLALLGTVDEEQGKYEDALARTEAALAIFTETLGPDHPHIANVLNNLGTISGRMGRIDDGRAYHEQALALREKGLGPDHPDVAMSLANLSGLAADERDWAEVERLGRRAVSILEASNGPDHPEVASSLGEIGRSLIERGRAEEGLVLLERALRIVDGREEPAVDRLGRILLLLGRAQHRVGDGEAAARSLERALALPAEGRGQADIQAALAPVVWAAGDTERARKLADDAAREWTAEGKHPFELAEIVRWRSKH